MHAALRSVPGVAVGSMHAGSHLRPPRPAGALQVAPAAGAEPQLGLQVLCAEPDTLSHARLVSLREHVFSGSEAWGVDWCAAPPHLAAAAGRRCCCVGCMVLDADCTCLRHAAPLCRPCCTFTLCSQLAVACAFAPRISTCHCLATCVCRHLLHAALGNHSSRGGGGSSSSAAVQAGSGHDVKAAGLVSVVTVDQLLSMHSWQYVDVLKVGWAGGSQTRRVVVSV